MYGIALLLHVLAATVWTGGHIVLSLVVLPRVLRERDPQVLLRFESGYERIGIPALVIQVVTGLLLAHRMLGSEGAWFDWSDPVSRTVSIKLILLAATAAFAVDARFRLIPRLSEENLGALAWHVVPDTLISIAYVFVGVSFRTGWLY